MANVKFLPKVIEYDRFQPEFYEDTITYITKRSSKKKLEKASENGPPEVIFERKWSPGGHF